MDPTTVINQLFTDTMTGITGIFTDISTALFGLISIGLIIFGLGCITKLFHTSQAPERTLDEDEQEPEPISKGR